MGHNLWSLYNLGSSPYFYLQATLGQDWNPMPMPLFVSGQKEGQLLPTTIGSSPSSRQAVPGAMALAKQPWFELSRLTPWQQVNGLHLILFATTEFSTTEAVRTVVQRHTQVG